MSVTVAQPIEDRIRPAVEDIPGIAVLLVFGSRARGDERPDSDLDIAVLPEAGLAEADEEEDGSRRRLKLLRALTVALADLVSDERVDVVFLDQAPDTLRQRVMEHGRMVICRDLPAWRALRVKTMREYGDREWYRRIYRRELRRRLLEGRSSGRSAQLGFSKFPEASRKGG